MENAMAETSYRTSELERYVASLKQENSELQAKVSALELKLFALGQKRLQNSSLLLSAIMLFVVFIIPQFIKASFAEMIMGFGAAIVLTTMFCLHPESYRSRTGSLIPASCLIAAIWLGAIAVSILPFIKRH